MTRGSDGYLGWLFVQSLHGIIVAIYANSGGDFLLIPKYDSDDNIV